MGNIGKLLNYYNEISSTSGNTTETTGSSNVSSTSAQSNFDKNFSGLKELKFKDNTNLYDNLKNDQPQLVNLINGEYDKILNNLDKKSELYNNLSTAKKAAWYGLNTVSSDVNKGYDYLQKSAVVFNSFLNNYGKLKKPSYLITDDYKALSKKEYDVVSEDLKVFTDEEGAPIQSSEKPMKDTYSDKVLNVKTQYFKIKGVTDGLRTDVEENALSPIVNTWYDSGLKSIKQLSAQNKVKMYEMSRDALLFIEKYGTKDNDKGNKGSASAILNELRNKSWNEKLDIINNKYSSIRNLVNSMGFYGKEYLYNKYKDQVKNENAFFKLKDVTDYNKAKTDLYNVAENKLAYYKDFNASVIEDKKAIVKDIETRGFDQKWGDELDRAAHGRLFSKILDDNGKILEYNDWIKTLSADRSSLDELDGVIYNTQIGAVKKQALRSANIFTNPMNLLSSQSIQNNAYMRDAIINERKNLYKKYVDKYKSSTVHIETKTKYNTRKVIDPNLSSSLVGYDGIDLSFKGKEGSHKHEIAKNVIDMIYDEENENLKTGVIAISGKGGANSFNQNISKVALSESEAFLTDPKWMTESTNAYQKFFKGDKPRKNVAVAFEKNTMIPGYAAYHFLDNETKDNVTLFVPAKTARKNKEFLFDLTQLNAEDYKWQRDGAKELALPGFKKAVILKTEDGVKLEGTRTNGDNISIPINTYSEDISTIEELIRRQANSLNINR